MIQNKAFYMNLLEYYKKNQVIVAIEELSEMQRALTKALRGKVSKCNIAEAIADVTIMLEQMLVYFDISETLVQEYREDKLQKITTKLIEELK